MLCSDPSLPLKARIVATIGPATFDTIEQFVGPCGATIRMNMAFIYESSDIETYLSRIRRVRSAVGNNMGIMLDAVGPRVKLGKLPIDGVTLKEGGLVTITTRKIAADDGAPNDDDDDDTLILPTIFERLGVFVKEGDPILLKEGQMRLVVERVENHQRDIICRIIKGGHLTKRGINLPKTHLAVPALSDKDRTDLTALLTGDKDNREVDMVALSFVRTAGDVEVLREFLAGIGRSDVRIMSKIETTQAVEDIDNISLASDSLMVARGDLWCELDDPWTLPAVTLQIIAAGRRRGIPVVTATQVMSSMKTSPVPTRAEVDELYHLLCSGTDCVMMSEETATGEYPGECVQAVRNVAAVCEKSINYNGSGYVTDYHMMHTAGGGGGANGGGGDYLRRRPAAGSFGTFGTEPAWNAPGNNTSPTLPLPLPISMQREQSFAISQRQSSSTNRDQRRAAVDWADRSTRVRCIVVISDTGASARAVYRERPKKPLLIITNSARTARYLQLFQVLVVHVPYTHSDQMNHTAIANAGLVALVNAGRGKSGGVCSALFGTLDNNNGGSSSSNGGTTARTAILVTNRRVSPDVNLYGVQEIMFPA